MSHYSCEVIIPPTDDVKKSIDEVMNSFNKYEPCSWYDCYEIGGRYSGNKIIAEIGGDKIESFIAELKKQKITVSCIQAGKETLAPASQQKIVDELWRKTFPDKGDVCPLFDHYKGNSNICTVTEIPEKLSAYRLIIAGPKYSNDLREFSYENGLTCQRMLVQEFWNGVEYQRTTWDGNVKEGIEMLRAKNWPIASNWLVVTIDYHN